MCLFFCYLLLILHIAVAIMSCTTNDQDITMNYDVSFLLLLLLEARVEMYFHLLAEELFEHM